MDEITHIGANGIPIPIDPPMPEEVLSEDFDYSKLITNPNNRGSICYKLFIDETISYGF